MKKKSMFSVICKTVMVLLTMLSLSFSNQISVKAWDSSIPHEFTRVKNIRYPEWWARKVPGLKGWSTYSTKYNGQWAYCLESSKNTPPNGQYVAEVIENNEAVRKLMYYGFGGPGATGEFAPGYDLKAAICPNDSYLTNDDVKYLLTHIFLSGAYSGDWNGFSESGFNAAFGGTYGTNIMNICRRIVALPEPGYAKFNPSSASDGSEAKDDIQWVELSKDSDGVWRAWKQMPEDGEYYIHAYYNTVSQENKVSFTTSYTPEAPVMDAVNNRIMGKVSIVKSDEETGKKLGGAVYNITAKNDILSPQGTVINKAGDLAGTLTTDENGYGELNGLHLGQYILSEVKPPDGYHTGKDIEFNLTAENNSADIVSSELNVTDRPNRFKIKKVDKDTGEALKDAKFEIYDVTADKTAGSLVSNKNGEAELSRLKPSLYYICEVKAPEGYKLNETKYYFEIDSLGNASVSDMNGTENSGAFFIDENGDLTVTVKNEINLWNLRLVKKNDAGKTLEDAEFTLYRDKDCTDPIGKGTTDKDGRVNFDRIVAGEYYLLETKAPAGYRKIEAPLKVSLRSEDGKFSFYINDEAVKTDDENNSLTVENGLYTGSMTVINRRGSLLPGTGSSMMLIVTGAGVCICLYIIKKKREKKNYED